MMRLMVDARAPTPVQALHDEHHKRTGAGVPPPIGHARRLVRRDRVDGIDPPLVHGQERIGDGASYGRDLRRTVRSHGGVLRRGTDGHLDAGLDGGHALAVRRYGVSGEEAGRDAPWRLGLGLGFALGPHMVVCARLLVVVEVMAHATTAVLADTRGPPANVIHANVPLALGILVRAPVVYRIRVHDVDAGLALPDLALAHWAAPVAATDEPVEVERIGIPELTVDVAHAPVDNFGFEGAGHGRSDVGEEDLGGVGGHTAAAVAIDDRPEGEADQGRVILVVLPVSAVVVVAIGGVTGIVVRQGRL
mmetsp:Transcript_5728/g.14315  ORF Transcript_5728/g.14315 Transcript_5728/m.14315 type:complete len:306 (+) Transcript_5728:2499-3416(+)